MADEQASVSMQAANGRDRLALRIERSFLVVVLPYAKVAAMTQGATSGRCSQDIFCTGQTGLICTSVALKSRQIAFGPRHRGTTILHGMPRYATVRQRMKETFPVSIVSKLLMRVIKAHARWRWRA